MGVIYFWVNLSAFMSRGQENYESNVYVGLVFSISGENIIM